MIFFKNFCTESLLTVVSHLKTISQKMKLCYSVNDNFYGLEGLQNEKALSFSRL